MSKKYDDSNTRALGLAIAAALAVALAAPSFADSSAGYGAKSSDTSKTEKATKVKTKAVSHVADQKFLDSAMAGSAREIAAARLAQERGVNAKVRDIANQLVRDHQSLLGSLHNTAVALGVPVDRSYVAMVNEAGTRSDSASSGVSDDMSASTSGSTGAMGSTGSGASTATASGMTGGSKDPEVQALSRRTGADFDRAFIDRMISDHQNSISKFTKASTDTSLSSQTRSLASQSLPTLRNHLQMAKTVRASL